MSKAAKSLLVFGIYLVIAGIGFLVIPNMVLGLLGFPETSEPWIRVVGVLVVFIGYYYIRAANNDLKPFFSWTVHARVGVMIVFSVMVVLGLADPMLIGFGLIDLLGAIWTGLALRSS